MKNEISKILIVDDEQTLCDTLSEVLKDEGYETDTAYNGEGAIELLKKSSFDVVFCDLKMPKVDGMKVLEAVQTHQPHAFFIIMTAYGSTESTLEALRMGAYDYLIKPLNFDDVLLKLKHLIDFKSLSVENRLMSGNITEKFAIDNILGQGPEMKAIYSLMQKVAGSSSIVLITGEMGVGKELLARAIHYRIAKDASDFFVIHCGSYSERQLDDALFGSDGLLTRKPKGTLFLDQIESLDPNLQKKLADVLSEPNFSQNNPLQFVIATTRDLSKEVAKGNFREDLYFKVNVVELKIPPLRARKNDIPFLVKYFVRVLSEEIGTKIRYVSDEALDILIHYPWKGNVRELQVVLERAILLSTPDTQYLDVQNLPTELVAMSKRSDSSNFKEAMRYYEVKHIQWVLEKNRFDKKKSASDLGLSLSSLYRKIEEHSMTIQ